MTINADTKIAAVTTQLPDAIKVLAHINSRFAKLCNPIVRKLLAGKLSLAIAAKIGRCNLKDIYDKLIPLGFKIDDEMLPHVFKNKKLPGFIPGLQQAETFSVKQYANLVDKKTVLMSAALTTEIPKDWNETISNYKDNIQTVDLRPLDMEQAMSAIAGELRYLDSKTALLFVLHSHLPVFYLDEFAGKQLDYHVKVIAEGEVNVLVFRY